MPQLDGRWVTRDEYLRRTAPTEPDAPAEPVDINEPPKPKARRSKKAARAAVAHALGADAAALLDSEPAPAEDADDSTGDDE